ncbi:MAG: asparagine--tRNA ligase [archaeon]|nr:asparagine--tRNA ligase [archaeon]
MVFKKEEFVSIAEALKKKKGIVALHGWAKRKRDIAETVFVLLRDSSSEIQCVFEKKDFSEKQWAQLFKQGIEASLFVKGNLVEEKRAPNGFELKAKEFELIGESQNFPIGKDLSEEFLLNVRHLWLRSGKMTAINKIRHTILFSIRQWHDANGFFEISPAIITPNACEGGTTLFPLDYFGEKRFLSQSAQMYAEVMIFSLEKVFGLTPSFRAEKSKTARHLTEYWHLEGEIAWGNMFDMMKYIEEMVAFICQQVGKRNPKELELLGRNPEELLKIKTPFKKITYDEALDLLKKENTILPWGADLSIKEEKIIAEKEKQPFFVYGYPTAIKSFYVKEQVDPKKCFSFDLMGGEGYGEMCTGGQREDVIENMVKKLKKEKIPIENYEWYLDLRRYGSVPHSGYGLGIERLIYWMCKLDTIKDAIPFPRTINRSYP